MTQQKRLQQSNGTSRRSHRIQRRKLDILKVAARLFAERGYERTTLEMIADELGLSKPSLYYYVKSKEDILADIFQEIFQRILQRVQTDVSADLEPQVRLHYRFETLLRRPYGKMLVWKAKTSLYRGTSLRLKA
jgi:TetR/AcrR family transcriptional regulator, cholesterol catabolism regulator